VAESIMLERLPETAALAVNSPFSSVTQARTARATPALGEQFAIRK
jgi:hypothetical protein